MSSAWKMNIHTAQDVVQMLILHNCLLGRATGSLQAGKVCRGSGTVVFIG